MPAIDPTIRSSDILTSMTILVSVIALLLSWSKDHELNRRAQADRIRSASAKTLEKLDRWQSLQLSIFGALQPVFLETSEMLGADFNVIAARDQLWKEINTQHTRVSAQVLEEQIETAYIDLFVYCPSARKTFLTTLSQLRTAEQIQVDSLLLETQAAIKLIEGKKASYSAQQGAKALRDAARNARDVFLSETDKILEPMRTRLYQLISQSDAYILSADKLMCQ